MFVPLTIPASEAYAPLEVLACPIPVNEPNAAVLPSDMVAPDKFAVVNATVQYSELLIELTHVGPLLPLGFDAEADTVIYCDEAPLVGFVNVKG